MLAVFDAAVTLKVRLIGEMFQTDGHGHANKMPQDEITKTGMSQSKMLAIEPFGIEVTESWMLIVHCCLHHV